MTTGRLNKLSAAFCATGAVLLFAVREPFAAFLWILLSLIWFLTGFTRRGRRPEPAPGRKLARRISRLLMWS